MHQICTHKRYHFEIFQQVLLLYSHMTLHWMHNLVLIFRTNSPEKLHAQLIVIWVCNLRLELINIFILSKLCVQIQTMLSFNKDCTRQQKQREHQISLWYNAEWNVGRDHSEVQRQILKFSIPWSQKFLKVFYRKQIFFFLNNDK